ncbi:MAG TPA: alkaline phosphatase family protein [Gemmatimonadales bacterium]|nr:alkaline phosphatase family protein [Gemmatimonadales bacterium]
MPSTAPRLLLIGLDAADPELIDRWTSDGTLPNLAALRRAGISGRLASSAQHLAGSPWPTFYTGQPPSQHGLYHDYQWRAESMGFAAPGEDWLSLSPFWRHLGARVSSVIYDMPMALGMEPFNGVEVAGWAAHDKLAPPASHPADLLSEIKRRFGEWHIGPESYGAVSAAELLELRDQLRDGVRRSTDLALWLLERPWNLAIVAFGALHRGGHRLFDRTSIAGAATKAQGASFDGALRELYVECDAALGRLVAAAPDATVIAFSVHGMMANTARVDLLEDMLARVLNGNSSAHPKRGMMRRFGEAIPTEWRRAITARVPRAFRERLVNRWATGGIAWDRTRAFTLRADLQGYVRLNLQGRERQGIVPPASVAALRDQIAEGLLTFRDAATGEPLIAAIEPIDGLFPDGNRRDNLPDIVVRWSDAPAAPHVAVESPRFGRIERATPGRIPNGRSGNHRGEGFIIARGPGIAAGARLGATPHILDLAPTVVRLLGTTSSVPLAGRVLPELVGSV